MWFLKQFCIVFFLLSPLCGMAMKDTGVLRTTDDLLGIFQNQRGDLVERMQEAQCYLEKHKGEKYVFNLQELVAMLASALFDELYEKDALLKSVACVCAKWTKAGLVPLPQNTELGLLLQRELSRIDGQDITAACYSLFISSPEEKINKFPEIFKDVRDFRVQCALFNDCITDCLSAGLKKTFLMSLIKKLMDPKTDQSDVFASHRNALLKRYDCEGNKKLIEMLGMVKAKESLITKRIAFIRSLAKSGFVFGSRNTYQKPNKWLRKIKTVDDVDYLLRALKNLKEDAIEIHRRYPAINRIPTEYADTQFKFAYTNSHN